MHTGVVGLDYMWSRRCPSFDRVNALGFAKKAGEGLHPQEMAGPRGDRPVRDRETNGGRSSYFLLRGVP